VALRRRRRASLVAPTLAPRISNHTFFRHPKGYA
jgi:hypothetical protein